jgi:hypothetical protein
VCACACACVCVQACGCVCVCVCVGGLELKFHSVEEGGMCNYHYALKPLRWIRVSPFMCSEYGEVGVRYELVRSLSSGCMQLQGL